ncbi:MAG TPA: leucine-rich repeat domain-containing protein [Polyangia bacterium]|jgi:ankyrin repeat protein
MKKTSEKNPAPRGSKDAPGTVTIRDAGLRKGLEQALPNGAVNGMKVDLAALAAVHKIDWSEDHAEAFPDQWKSIGDLKGLEYATSLRELSAWGNSIKSLSPLANLTELEEVWVFDNAIKTTAGLANKPKLRELNLHSNPLESIAELHGLPALEELDLDETRITDLSPLLELPKLRKLDVARVKGARTAKNVEVLVALAQRKVALRMDPELQQAFEQAEAAVLSKTPSTDPMVERLRLAGQPALALLWQKGGAAAKDGDWNTLLHRVVLLEDKALSQQAEPDAIRADLIKELARAGVAIDAQNEAYGHHTALSLALDKARSPAVIQALLEAGASPRLPRLKPALAVALERRAVSVVIEQLVAAGADVTHPEVLEQAADKGAADLVAPVARKIDWRTQVYLNTPALATAVYRNDDRMVDLLLDAGAPAAAGRNYPAVFYVHTVAMLEKLIAHGADPLVHTTYGTALHALRRSSPEASALIDRLVDLGVPVDARNFQGRTALFELTAEGSDWVDGKWVPKPAVLTVAQKLIARGADPNVRIWQPGVSEWPEAWTLLDAKHGDEFIRQLGGVTTAVWARRQVKVVTGAKALEGEALEALTELALAGLLKKLGADQERIEKQIIEMLRARTDAVSKALVPFGAHPLTLLWLARGANGRDLFGRGMLQIAAWLPVEPQKEKEELAAMLHPLMRALCEQGAPVDVTDGRGDGALDAYLGRANNYRFAPDASLVRALIPKSRDVITNALIELCGFEKSRTSERDPLLDLLVEASADLTNPEAFAALCRTRRADLVRRALEAGADPAWDRPLSDKSALKEALEIDDLPVVEMLLDAGTPPDIGWENIVLAFHEARSPEALELLCRHKLDLSLRRSYGKRTLIDSAVEHLLASWTTGDLGVIRANARYVSHLVATGWSLDAVDNDGKTPRARLQKPNDDRVRAAIAEAKLL